MQELKHGDELRRDHRRNSSVVKLTPEQHLTRVMEQATELSKSKLHELLIPMIKHYQSWVNELAALAIGSDDEGLSAE